ncbi:MAG: hypothetical protein GX605_12280 [Chloroflexi bacterium]|nr:hypothetical protein [Chloroflexota bacterium]
MILTPRQHAFLRTLQELYQGTGEPVHYSDLAAEVGVSRFSAYDMLRLLERKGAAASAYALSEEKAGPGRSRVVFCPTEAARNLLRQAAALPRPRLGDWKRFQTQIIDRLEGLREEGAAQVARQLLDELPRRRSPLHYCAETLAAFLATLQGQAANARPLQALAALAESGEEALSLAVGLSLGSLLSQGDCDTDLRDALLRSASRYQQQLGRLNDEARESLSQFLQKALQTVANVAPPMPESR